MFTEAVELDADLVVDSVKQPEIMSHAADGYQLPTRFNGLSTEQLLDDGRGCRLRVRRSHRPGRIVRPRFHIPLLV
jgi:hypothetical protein